MIEAAWGKVGTFGDVHDPRIEEPISFEDFLRRINEPGASLKALPRQRCATALSDVAAGWGLVGHNAPFLVPALHRTGRRPPRVDCGDGHQGLRVAVPIGSRAGPVYVQMQLAKLTEDRE